MPGQGEASVSSRPPLFHTRFQASRKPTHTLSPDVSAQPSNPKAPTTPSACFLSLCAAAPPVRLLPWRRAPGGTQTPWQADQPNLPHMQAVCAVLFNASTGAPQPHGFDGPVTHRRAQRDDITGRVWLAAFSAPLPKEKDTALRQGNRAGLPVSVALECCVVLNVSILSGENTKICLSL